ncbi:unnamed protein product [Mytilus edulis]|uniref:Uncharacterized protein n=1 Tax=Mytilus edulis TaxID=6550 RepID=A0A8S3R0P7_MYTED|nr:unnamed protein product [Mytilus edulis]
MQKDFDSVTEAGDIINSENVVHRQTSTPKSDEASAGVRPKLPSSTNIVSELDKTIQELTIQNKILERDLLAKQHELLVAKKTSGGESSRTKAKDNDKKRTAVSGEARAAKDRVKYDVPWPHEHAQTKSVNYSDKDFGLAQLVRENAKKLKPETVHNNRVNLIDGSPHSQCTQNKHCSDKLDDICELKNLVVGLANSMNKFCDILTKRMGDIETNIPKQVAKIID